MLKHPLRQTKSCMGLDSVVATNGSVGMSYCIVKNVQTCHCAKKVFIETNVRFCKFVYYFFIYENWNIGAKLNIPAKLYICVQIKKNYFKKYEKNVIFNWT
jgi:hypothetical protein